MNKAEFIGRITKDLEVKYAPNGDKQAVVRFNLAVKRNRGVAEGHQDTDFVPCTAFGKLAENLGKYQKKGNKIAVVAHYQSSEYVDANGVKQYSHTFVCDEVEYLDAKSETQEAPAQAPVSQQVPAQQMAFAQQVAPQQVAQTPVQQIVSAQAPVQQMVSAQQVAPQQAPVQQSVPQQVAIPEIDPNNLGFI